MRRKRSGRSYAVSAWESKEFMFIRGCGARDGFLRGLNGVDGKKYRVEDRSCSRGLLAAHKGK